MRDIFDPEEFSQESSAIRDAYARRGNEQQVDMEHIPNVPTLFPIPTECRRLIDEGLMHFEASQRGFAERHTRGETSHTLHVWWARRPHSAMRALTFATLCRSQTQRDTDLMDDLVSSNVGETQSLAAAESSLKRQYGRRPRILDMFGGGGTIPLEGVNLGADVSATDINEMSVFIQRCHLEYVGADRIEVLANVVAKRGNAVLERLLLKTHSLFPLREKTISDGTRPGPITYLWSYSQICPSCGYRQYLSKRQWLSRKRDIATRIHLVNEAASQVVKIVDVPKNETVDAVGPDGSCAKCAKPLPSRTVKDCTDEAMALVLSKVGSGKRFVPANMKVVSDADEILRLENQALETLGASLPSTKLPVWSGIVNAALYGIETHADVLNPRQRAVLLMLLAELKTEFHELSQTQPKEEAKFVIGVLTGLCDQLIDWNCRLSMWIPQNEQIGRAFCGPGVPMLWDYAESDPLLTGPGNLWAKLERLVTGCSSLSLRRGSAKITRAIAQSLPYEDSQFDAVVTDPPYYDNIYYNVLADFFFAWKRLVLRSLEPELFASHSSAEGGGRELVASSQRSGSSKLAHSDYCVQLSLALAEAARVLRPDGVISFVYSHASFGGWLALIQAFRSSPLQITSAQPLSIERKARPRAIGSVAVNTCITFVGRKTGVTKEFLDRETALQQFEEYVRGGFSVGLEAAGWQAEDAAMALFAQGVGLLAGSMGIQGTTDQDALEMFERAVKEIYPSLKITKRGSL